MTPERGREVLERDVELAALNRRLAGARAGRGGLALIEAAAGMGKTALIAAAAARATELGMDTLRATGAELEREFPFGVVLQLFEARLRAAPPHERDRLLAGAAAHVEPLLSGILGRAPTDPAAALPLHHGLLWLTSNLAERAPLLVCVDDAQWADAPSLAYLAYLLPRLEELPVALLVAARRDEAGAAAGLARLAEHPGAELVRPAPLSRQGAARLLRTRAPDADAGFCEACAEVTGGNPFLLLTLVDGLLAEGVAASAEAAARVRRSAPEKVLRAVVARLRRLPSDARVLARAVATLGSDASPRLAAALADLDADAAAEATDALIAAGLVELAERLEFAHPLLRSAVYADIAPAARMRMHARAARALIDDGAPPERAAAQLLESSPAGELWAVAVLRAAAARALGDGAPASAVRLLRRALDEPPAPGARGELLVELGRAEALAGDPTAAERFEHALEHFEAPAARAGLLLELGRALYAQGRLSAAAEAFERGCEVLEGAAGARGGDGAGLEGELRAGWAAVARLLPALRPRVRAYVKGLPQDGDPASHGERVLLVHAAEELIFAGTDRDRALALTRSALGDGALLAQETSDGMNWFLAAANLSWCDELDGYEREVEAGLADARRRGSVWGFAKASYLRSYATYFTGRLADAVADAQGALDAARYGWEQFLPAVHMWLAWSLTERGELAEARRTLNAVEGDPRWSRTTMQALVLGARARLELADGDPRRALEALLAAGRIATDALIVNPALIVPWRSWAALAAGRLGETARARELVEEELELARRFGAPRPIGMALRVAGLVAGGRAGIALLEESAELLATTPAALEHARALIDLGAALRRGNRRAAARDPLRRGLDMAHRFGAKPLEDQAREELLATGARPRRLLLTGLESLTPSERRVAELAARGLTNRDIAQALFVSLKTVEAHLAHVFRKLDVAGRERLSSVLSDAA